MMGSGTTIVEAYIGGRRAIGFDIDPLARLVSRVKVTPIDIRHAANTGRKVMSQARAAIRDRQDELVFALDERWDQRTHDFVDYWFAQETQVELLALRNEIEKIEDESLRAFFDLAFSAIIITKNGGVSLSLDLAHTRPHKAKIVYNQEGAVIVGEDLVGSIDRRIQFLTKTLRSPIVEFEKRLYKNLQGVVESVPDRVQPDLGFGDAQRMPIDDGTVDLIVTSPPYASNAIDYMRAHKFSLVWMGYQIDDLGQKRKEYIGGEATSNVEFEELPNQPQAVIEEIAKIDSKKARVLCRYYSEMTRVLGDMFRVLKSGRASIVVVGSSVMRGIDTRTETCLADIGQTLGFDVPKIGVRELDRNRRMMPAGTKVNLESQIQQRMHEEFVIGFCKPEA
jgi:hypothetical protein